MNPILPLKYFVPDVEARQWKDGRLYLYGSYDISGNTFYCSHKYHVFSSDDLVNWTKHDVSFNTFGEDADVKWSQKELYAPDCIYKNGIYYLYFCMSDNSEGVATSDQPYGPFKNAVPVEGANGDSIDPAVLVDDDGQVYYYWGQFNLRGARLKENMSQIDGDTLCKSLLNEVDHGFHEGPSIRKINGIYYMVYTDISRGKATCLAYATSNSPLGPFKKGGVIIDNIGCDKETWNNHGSIAEFNGNWYIFYHRSSQGSIFNRRVCMEPIYLNEDGSIKEVEMTTQGMSGYIDAGGSIEAYRACLLFGSVRTEVGYQANNDEVYEFLSFIQDGDWAGFKYLDFGAGISQFEVDIASLAEGGYIEIRIDSPNGNSIGECRVPHTGGWEKWLDISCDVNNTIGVHSVYLIFKGHSGRLFNIKNFRFIR